MDRIDGEPRRKRVERGIYRQWNGKYAICVTAEGRPRFRTSEATTLAEARTEREALALLARLGQLPLSSRLTVAAIAARWLAEFEAKVARGERRGRTLDFYRTNLRCHLLPRLGRRQPCVITADDIAELTRDLHLEGLAPWTIKGILGTLSCVFSYAYRRGYVCSHPYPRLERDERPHPRSPERRVLDRTELVRLLASCPKRSQPLLATAIFTGLRLSELLALSWDDVDFAGGVIHVRHQLARGRRGVPPRRVPPKTQASLREIPLLPQLAALLREHRYGSRFSEGADYVFASACGTPLLHHNVSRRVLRRAAVRAGLDGDGRRVRFHDLRHTFGSHLIIDIGLDVAQVSRILGHARTSFTLDTYTHLFAQSRHADSVRTQLAAQRIRQPARASTRARISGRQEFSSRPLGLPVVEPDHHAHLERGGQPPQCLHGGGVPAALDLGDCRMTCAHPLGYPIPSESGSIRRRIQPAQAAHKECAMPTRSLATSLARRSS